MPWMGWFFEAPDSIDLQNLLGKNLAIGIQQADGSESYINGYFDEIGFDYSDGSLSYYSGVVMSWFDFLKRRIDSRIYQHLSAIDVVRKIFDEEYPGYAEYELRLTRDYPEITFLVMRNESYADFVSRVLESVGVFYYFEFTKTSCKMILCDASRLASCCPKQQQHAKVEFNAGNRTRSEGTVTRFSARRRLQSNKITLNTYNYKAGDTQRPYLETSSVVKQGNVPVMEIYDGNPAYLYSNWAVGKRLADQRMDVLDWQTKVFSGASDCHGLIPGHTMQLTGHPWLKNGSNEDATFLILSVEYDARNNFTGEGEGDGDGNDVYTNTFTCIRRDIPYRPPEIHPHPIPPGIDYATVVGPPGMEIWTDGMGRIQVQFKWDRYGKHTAGSSCWIRVTQPWAGGGYGTISIPRVGQEVGITYAGSYDRPVCIGGLFNASHPPPYSLPDEAHRMGFKSRSTPGGGGHSEMVIHDKKGSELVNMHAQKDFTTTVLNNHTTTVNGPEQKNIVANGKQTNIVKQDIEITSVEGSIFLTATEQILLRIGESTYVQITDGKILVNGKQVGVFGPDGIRLNR